MKKRILALSLALAMMAMMIPTAVFAATLTKTSYYDYDFDQTGDTATSWTNVADSGYKMTRNHANVTNGAQELATDTIRGSKAVKISFPQTTADQMYRFGQEGVNLTNLDSYVVWYEMSFMCETGFMNLNFNTANFPFAITQDGEIYLAGMKNFSVQNGDKVTNATLELGKWYHFVVAVDSLGKSTGGYPKLYAWLNGELLKTARSGEECSVIWNNVNGALPLSTMTNLRMMFKPSSTSASVFWLDNFKLYTVDQAVMNDEGATNYYDPYEIFGNASLSVSSFMQNGTDIYVPDTAKVSDVLDDAESEGSVRCFKDGVEVDETDYTTTSAVGTTLYVTTTSSLIGRSYALLSNKVKMMYYDMNFDTGAAVNAAGYNFGYAGGASTATATYVGDTVRNNKALKLSFAETDKFYLQGNNNFSLDLSDKVTWYELSFMAEDAMPAFEIRSQGRAFHVFDDGKISTGGQAGVSAIPANYLVDPDDHSKDFKFETGKWYHLVVAIDQIDTYVNSDKKEAAKLYAWVNGCLMHDATGLSNSYTGLANVNSTASQLSKTTQMNLYAVASAAGSLYIDNYKIYTTITSVADYGYDPMSIYNGAPTPNESYLTADGTVYAPTGTTLETVKASFSEGVVAESGDTLYALTADGAYAKPYTLTTVDEGYMFVPNTVRLEYENGNKTTVSSLNYTNKVRLRGILTNFGGEAKNGVLVLAAYNGDKLQSCVLTPVTSGTEAMTDYITIGDTEDLTIRAFLWNSTTGLSPAMSTVYSE